MWKYVKDRKRRAELRWVAAKVKQFSEEPVARMSGEEYLRAQVRRHVTREGRLGIDGTVVDAVEHLIDAHVIELEAEIFQQHEADDVKLGELQAKLDGLATQFREEERYQDEIIGLLRYQRRAAMRQVEDRNTPMPAGADGVEEAGHQHGNVGDLAGRTWRSQIILYVVLFLAMTADLVTFRQVVERVVNESSVFAIVLALTAMTTYVAHRAGDMLKGAKEVNRTVRRSIRGWALFGTWVAMGIGIFLFRLLAPAPVAGDAGNIYVSSGGTTGGSGGGSAVLSACLLGLLYVLTGAIAIAAGYGRLRPEIEQFRRTHRMLRRREPRLAALRRDVVETESLHRQLTELRVSREEQYKVELGRCEAAAARVKAEVSILIRRLLRAAELTWLQRLRGEHRSLADDRPVPGPRTSDEHLAPEPSEPFPDQGSFSDDRD